MSRFRKNPGTIPFAQAVHTNVIDFADGAAAGKLAGLADVTVPGLDPAHALVAGPPAYLSINSVVYVPQENPSAPAARRAPSPRGEPSVPQAMRPRDRVRQFMDMEATGRYGGDARIGGEVGTDASRESAAELRLRVLRAQIEGAARKRGLNARAATEPEAPRQTRLRDAPSGSMRSALSSELSKRTTKR